MFLCFVFADEDEDEDDDEEEVEVRAGEPGTASSSSSFATSSTPTPSSKELGDLLPGKQFLEMKKIFVVRKKLNYIVMECLCEDNFKTLTLVSIKKFVLAL